MIRGAAIANGLLVGMVPLPEPLLSPRPNRGLESLAVEPDGSSIYTANEEATASDGPEPRAGLGTIVRLCAIPVPATAIAVAVGAGAAAAPAAAGWMPGAAGSGAGTVVVGGI